MLVAAQRARGAARAERHAGLAGRHPADRRGVGRARRRAPGTRTARSPRRRSPPAPTARRRAARATSATPGASGSASRSIADRTPLRARDVRGVGGEPVGEVDHRVRAARGERRPLAQARQRGAAGAHERRRRPARAPSSTASPRGRGCAERAGDADEVARPGSVAPDQLLARVGPAGDGDARVSTGARRRRRRRSWCAFSAQRLHARAPVRAPAARRSRAGSAQRDVGLAGLGAHRGQVGERAGHCSVADLGRRRPALGEAEVHALDHRVDGGHAQRAARARRPRRRPSPRTMRGQPGGQLGRDGFDQGARSAASPAQRWR